MSFTIESIPFQIFTAASITLASYLSIIYCKRRHSCKLCKISKNIKNEYNCMKLRRSPRLAEKKANQK